MDEKWKMFKQIVGLCHGFNGTIFGGAVRDSYIHDHDARKFYQTYDAIQYQDTQITEFPGRFVVPNDIDCMMMADDHEHLLTTLHQRFHVKGILNSDANYLAGVDIPEGHYRFKRYSIVDLKDVPVVLQLDMIVQVQGDKLTFPFKQTDMDVNALWWTRHSMIINPNEVRHIGMLHDVYTSTFAITYTTLFENIRLKKATICTPTCPPRRILKMKQYGWEIHYTYNTIQISNDPYDGVCVLCQETIEGDHSTFECKCAHICMECLTKHYDAILRCTICKNPVNQESLKNEVCIYNAIRYDKDLQA